MPHFRHVLSVAGMFITCVYATISISFHGETTPTHLTVFNAVSWNAPIFVTAAGSLNLTDIPLIPVDVSSGDFDPCDDTTFNSEHVMEHALTAWLVQANLTDLPVNSTDPQSLPWIAYLGRDTIQTTCARSPLWWYYAYYAVEVAQRLGASALVIDQTDVAAGSEKVSV